MAEAARRYQQAGGSDLVRRLMARPVRLEQQVRTRMPLRDPRPVDARAEAYAETFADDAEARDEADEIARLEAELQVMKAVLRAQRQEAHGRGQLSRHRRLPRLPPKKTKKRV